MNAEPAATAPSTKTCPIPSRTTGPVVLPLRRVSKNLVGDVSSTRPPVGPTAIVAAPGTNAPPATSEINARTRFCIGPRPFDSKASLDRTWARRMSREQLTPSDRSGWLLLEVQIDVIV